MFCTDLGSWFLIKLKNRFRNLEKMVRIFKYIHKQNLTKYRTCNWHWNSAYLTLSCISINRKSIIKAFEDFKILSKSGIGWRLKI